MAALKYERLRELSTEYINTKNSVVFAKIIACVDDLIVYTIKRILKYQKYLYGVEVQDLYNSAIVGLHKGIISSKHKESGRIVCVRIIQYIKKQIISDYYNTFLKEKNNVSLPIDYLGDRYESNFCCFNVNSFSGSSQFFEDQITIKEILQKCFQLFLDGTFSYEDIQIIKYKYDDGLKLREIGKILGKSHNYIKIRADQVIEVLRKNFIE